MSRPQDIETEGETVEEAVESGLSSLSASREDVDIEILSHPSRGVFGLGGRRARVRLTRRVDDDAGEAPISSDRGGETPLDATRRDDTAAAENARAALLDLLSRMGFNCSVAISAGEDTPVLEISGDNASVLIGKHGQTLDALEYIVNRLVSRDDEAPSRVHLDCEQYRVKRQRSLEELAQRVAEQVKSRGRSVALSPMSPRDRRIVHLALRDDPELTTRSTGEGADRRLVVLPEGQGGRGRSRSR